MSGMLAARLWQGGDRFVLEQIPLPRIQAGECLVEVRACAICATDLHIIDGVTQTAYRPIVLGHEAAGIVRDIGPDVEGLAAGDRVFVNPVVTCGVCHGCSRGRPHICMRRQLIGIHRDGAFAEYVAVPAGNLLLLPDTLSFEEAAIIESASTPYHALTSRAPVTPGDSVAVFGVGGLGIHAVQIARLAGARVIVAVDVAQPPLDRAGKLGATALVNARTEDPVAAIKAATDGGADVAIECVGRPETIAWSVESLRPGGVAALIGIGPESVMLPPTTRFAREEIEVRGVYAYDMGEVARVAALIDSGMIDARAAISEVMRLEDVNTALERFREKQSFPVRLVIAPRRRDPGEPATSAIDR